MTDTQASGSSAPRMSVRTQYVKDFSFENPNSPRSLSQSVNERPAITLDVDVETRQLGGPHYEVALRITIDAKRAGTQMFVAELLYAGLFALENFPPERIEPVCRIECPRILFPFARRIIAETTRDGGFPPLLLDPINFSHLYRQYLDQRVTEAEQPVQESSEVADAIGEGTAS
jgi:preprotein translocase subunit SecB